MYKSLSRFAIHEIVEILSKLDFESILIEIYNVKFKLLINSH